MVNGKQTISLIEQTAKYVQACGKRSILECKPQNLIFNPKEIGRVLPDGSINFQSVESAIKYAKSRIVKALNSQKPFERSVQINKNRVLREIDGTATSVNGSAFFDFDVAAHGHPDIFGKGLTTAPSRNDYGALITHDKQLKEIVFNSNGEYYSLTKKSRMCGFLENMETFDNFKEDYYRLLAKKFASKDVQQELENAIASRKIIEHTDIGKKLMKFATEMLRDEKPEVRKKICDATHEFWLKYKKKYNVEIETNFSNFKQK